jgi:hypothetical protein
MLCERYIYVFYFISCQLIYFSVFCELQSIKLFNTPKEMEQLIQSFSPPYLFPFGSIYTKTRPGFQQHRHLWNNSPPNKIQCEARTATPGTEYSMGFSCDLRASIWDCSIVEGAHDLLAIEDFVDLSARRQESMHGWMKGWRDPCIILVPLALGSGASGWVSKISNLGSGASGWVSKISNAGEMMRMVIKQLVLLMHLGKASMAFSATWKGRSEPGAIIYSSVR